MGEIPERIWVGTIMGDFKKNEVFNLSAIHEKELEDLLRNLGLMDEIKAGNVLCNFCEKKITVENLQSVFPLEGKIVFCCEDIRCYQHALESIGK